jgi:hypothetical protein
MEKINLLELLKDCPSGMELYSPMFDNLYFDYVIENNGYPNGYPIRCYLQNDSYRTSVAFNMYGEYTFNQNSKCVIFPKGKTSWDEFHRPFKDGDVVFYSNTIAIFKEWGDETLFRTYCVFYTTASNPTYQFETSRPLFGKSIRKEARFATEEEKQKLFDAIKANGYKWNPETKTLEKLVEPKFKDGDKIKHKTHISQGDVVTEIKDTHYVLDDESALPFVFQDEYELVANKFDLNTLVPFESKVLVRDKESHKWKPAIWGFYDKDSLDYQIRVVGGYIYRYCIPYDGNEHLLATTNDCNNYYKNWE